MAKPEQNVVTTTELARFIGVTPKTVREWVKEGLPTIEAGRPGRGSTHRFDSVVASRWITDREIAARVGEAADGRQFDPQREQARLNYHKANVEELRERQMRGELLEAREVVEICAAHIAAARQHVLSIHSKVRGRYPNIDQQVVDEIEQFAHQALNELGRSGVPEQLRNRLAGAVQDVDATGEVDAKPVGGRARPGHRGKRRARKVANKRVPKGDS